MERSMDATTFEEWRDERLDLAVAAALADVGREGVHVMPVTEEGYGGGGTGRGRHRGAGGRPSGPVSGEGRLRERGGSPPVLLSVRRE